MIWLVLALLLVPKIGTAAPPLRVGTSGDYAPFSKSGEGFDIEVARRFGSELGREIEWVPFRWPELSQRLRAGDFDVVMSGVTWRADRAVSGWLSRAVAAGGPCVLGRADSPEHVGVNRGGFLEGWARERYGAAVLAFDDNLSLPGRLASGEVDAIVTDSFELGAFRREGDAVSCEPPAWRKVYWVAPGGADELGPKLDSWLAAQESELRELRRRMLGGEGARSECDHLVDLLARRLALMPQVAAWKRQRDIPVQDPTRERRVLHSAAEAAARQGLDPQRVRPFFALQIQLAKTVQARVPAEPSTLDLSDQLRPTLSRLGERIVAALASGATLAGADPAPLQLWLRPDEIDALARAVEAVQEVPPRGCLHLNPTPADE